MYDARGTGLQMLAAAIAEGYADDVPTPTFDIATVRGFSVLPGDGCETAAFAFMKRSDETGSHREWFWHASYETQYASVFGDRHLFACHTGLVRLLDFAIGIGANVVVRDEPHNWETRDEAGLIAEVNAMNRVVAAFAGKLSDLGGLPDGQLRAPIFRHPRFERLEMDLED